MKLAAQMPGELADRRRLAGAVDPTAMITVGCARMSMRASPTRAVCASSPISRSLSASPPESSPAPRLGLERAHDRRGRARADVGEDQRFLQPLPGACVERAEQRRLDLAAKGLAGLRQVFAQAPEQPAPW